MNAPTRKLLYAVMPTLFAVMLSPMLYAQVKFVIKNKFLANRWLEGAGTLGAVVTDLNGDGIPDFVSGRYNVPPGAKIIYEFSVHLGDGKGGFVNATAQYAKAIDPKDMLYSPRTLAFDYDRDGDVDLFISDGAGFSKSTVRLYRNPGKGKGPLIKDSKAIKLPLYGCVGIWNADVNGDGWQDLFVAGNTTYADSLFLNDKKGGFIDKSRTHLPGLHTGGSTGQFADLDGDGDLDLLLVGYLKECFWLENTGNGIYIKNTRTWPYLKGYYNFSDVGDIDGDGDLDIVLVEVSRHAKTSDLLLFNDGHGGFKGRPLRKQAVVHWGLWPKFADFDQDGDLDLIMTYGLSKPLRTPSLFENNGYGVFTENLSAIQLTPYNAGEAHIADFDGDGDLDVLLYHTWRLWNTYKFRWVLLQSTYRQVHTPLKAERGKPYQVDYYAKKGPRFLLPIFGLDGKRVPMGMLGTLWIDPSAMVLGPLFDYRTASVHRLRFTFPNDAWLRYKTFRVQGLVLELIPSLPSRFTNVVEEVIWF